MQRKRLYVQSGDVFNRLTVMGLSHKDRHHRKHFYVKCVCGTEKTVQGSLLTSGNTQSCGCLSIENKKAQRLPNDIGVVNHIILQYKRHARDRGIEWGLSFEQVDKIIREPCHYCGDPAGNIKKTKNHPGFKHNGIDRRDNAKPYFIENVVACCGVCNIAKGARSEVEFIAWASRIADQWGEYLKSIERKAA